ncbi:unnamed protein product [Angiostrongylus costaricensis]|uniref:Uncharacterized protein n=1 Tax=Angiostrongylus costaricensis TaxID=334426 RepID=A0A0R3PF94_ANGCS|nr:unnamed protein product [Angiostrongylus costaricensis]
MALRVLVTILLATLFISQAFLIDSSDDLNNLVDYPMSKRNFEHIWRNIQMQMPGNHKRTESLTRARANAYYRLG